MRVDVRQNADLANLETALRPGRGRDVARHLLAVPLEYEGHLTIHGRADLDFEIAPRGHFAPTH